MTSLPLEEDEAAGSIDKTALFDGLIKAHAPFQDEVIHRRGLAVGGYGE